MNLPYAVYILEFSNGQPYTGFTEDIQQRLDKHQKGGVYFTKDKLLVYTRKSIYSGKKSSGKNAQRNISITI